MKPLSWLARRQLAAEHRRSEARAGVLGLKIKTIPEDVAQAWDAAQRDALAVLEWHDPNRRASRPCALATGQEPTLARLRARLARLRRRDAALIQAYRHVLGLAHHYGGAAIARTLRLPSPPLPPNLRTAQAIREATDATTRPGKAWRQVWMIEARHAFAIGTRLLAILRRPSKTTSSTASRI